MGKERFYENWRGVPLTIGIQNPSFSKKDWNQVPGIQNSRRKIQNPRLSWISLHGANLYEKPLNPDRVIRLIFPI